MPGGVLAFLAFPAEPETIRAPEIPMYEVL
jgi:hypothetical protein